MVFSAATLLSGLALMSSVVPAQNAAAPTIMMSPSAWRGSSAGVGKPNATSMPANDKRKADPLRRLKRSTGRKMRAPSHDEERREIDEQHRAGRRGVEQAVIDQDELGAEQRAGRQAPPATCRRARTAECRAACTMTRRRCAASSERTAPWMSGGMSCDRELHRDLVEAPGQAQHDDDGRGQRVERARDVMGGGRSGHCDCFGTLRRLQWAHTPVISITGVFGVKPAARDAVLDRVGDRGRGRFADRAALLADQEHDRIVRSS